VARIAALASAKSIKHRHRQQRISAQRHQRGGGRRSEKRRKWRGAVWRGVRQRIKQSNHGGGGIIGGAGVAKQRGNGISIIEIMACIKAAVSEEKHGSMKSKRVTRRHDTASA